MKRAFVLCFALFSCASADVDGIPDPSRDVLGPVAKDPAIVLVAPPRGPDADPCNWATSGLGHHPPGCVCALECPVPADPCTYRACSSGSCLVLQSPPGQPCGDGGTCTATGDCR